MASNGSNAASAAAAAIASSGNGLSASSSASASTQGRHAQGGDVLIPASTNWYEFLYLWD